MKASKHSDLLTETMKALQAKPAAATMGMEEISFLDRQIRP